MEYFFTDYNWIERQIYSNAEKLKQLGITDVVGISRGGICPAMMAAFILDIPKIHLINYNRDTNAVEWQGYREIGRDSVVLLCEDVAGDGRTLTDCHAYMKKSASSVYTLTVCHFNGSALKPDFGYYSGDVICIFPWERHSINPEERQSSRKFRKRMKKDSDYFKFGSDLDGVFLPDIDDALYHTDLARALKDRAALNPFETSLYPKIPLHETTLISGRPGCDHAITKEWLIRHRIPHKEVWLRNEAEIDFSTADDHYTKAERSAESKARRIKAEGITHFYESDPLQSILIANKLPMVRVCWWNNSLLVRKWVSADNHE